jgi:hypothetical protein
MFYTSLLLTCGTIYHFPFKTYSEAREFFRNRISYSPATPVKRVWVSEHDFEIDPTKGRAIWDVSWDSLSKEAGLKDGDA